MSRSTKTFYIENLGCAKNQVDAEILLRLLEDEGWVYSDQPEIADILIVNSCGFIEPAKEESIQSVIDLRDPLSGEWNCAYRLSRPAIRRFGKNAA